MSVSGKGKLCITVAIFLMVLTCTEYFSEARTLEYDIPGKLCEDLKSLLVILNSSLPVFYKVKTGRAVNSLQYNLNII